VHLFNQQKQIRMEAKYRFKEGWIMLNKPFKFIELEKPLQKMTVLYAYSEKPLVKMILTSEAQEEIDFAYDEYGLNIGVRKSKWRVLFNESEEDYNERFDMQMDQLRETGCTVEQYDGELVQCYVEGQLCKFYPDEYTVIKKDTFELLLTSESAHVLEIQKNSSYYNQDNVKDRIYYLRSRGINKDLATRMSSKEANDAVIFRPRPELLAIFCRPHEIY